MIPDATPSAEPLAAPDAPRGRLGLVLWGAAAIAVLAAGLILWADRGPAIFTDMVSAAIAWCF